MCGKSVGTSYAYTYAKHIKIYMNIIFIYMVILVDALVRTMICARCRCGTSRRKCTSSLLRSSFSLSRCLFFSLSPSALSSAQFRYDENESCLRWHRVLSPLAIILLFESMKEEREKKKIGPKNTRQLNCGCD